jgi:superfamily II DNA or RNA helicase
VRPIPVVIDSHIRVDGNLLGHDLTEQIFDELEIKNVEREKAEQTNRWGWWELPETFQLGALDGDTLVMPRGYALQFKLLMREHDMKVVWHDRRRWEAGPPIDFAMQPDSRYHHQGVAVRRMVKHQQGIYEAPTASGKTVTVIRFLQRIHPAHALILVDKLDLMNQWIAKLNDWLVVPDQVGQLGGGKQVIRRITVATVQTLWKRLDELVRMGFFNYWGSVTVDECHHVTADTIQNLVDRFTAKYRIGVSATPDRMDTKFDITQDVLGEVFHKDDEKKLQRRGILVKPSVKVVRTGFRFTYWGDHRSDEHGNCQVPGCRATSEHGHKNNYQALKDKLVFDDTRNLLVCKTIQRESHNGPHHHLVISDEVRHLEELYNTFQMMLGRDGEHPELFMLTGRIKGDKRKAMIRHISEIDSAIVFATVAKEGIDIPPIDRVYLPFPAANPKKVQQWVGRATRSHNGKISATVIDFLDINVGILKGQFRQRRFKCYDKLGMEVFN